ncbi:MAG: SDR family NAD(P)-dependent oxidoreductase [Caldicoprobacterales bacterium]
MLKCFDLTGETAIVTGAAKGLGRVFARALAQAGADIYLMGHGEEGMQETAREITSLGVQCAWRYAEITDQSQVEACIKDCINRFGKVDILVNNAAAPRINIPPEETDLDQWNQVLNTNITGSFICAQAAGKEMMKRRKGKIINLASISGFIINKGVHGGSYDVSKQAVVGLTRALAAEWAPYHINVNAIAPGYFLTDPNKNFFKQDPEFYNLALSMIPAQRIGDPEELSGAVVFLASEASSYMHGSVLVIDGGYTIW